MFFSLVLSNMQATMTSYGSEMHCGHFDNLFCMCFNQTRKDAIIELVIALSIRYGHIVHNEQVP